MSDVDALLDQFAGSAAAPSNAPTSGDLKDFYDANMSPAAQAVPKAVGAANDNPDEAAKALSISKETGIPASVVAADPKGAVADHRSAQAGKYVKQSSALQRYVNEYPLGASISADDYKNLDGIGLYAGAAFGVMPVDPAIAAKLPPFSWATGLYDVIKRVGDIAYGRDSIVSGSDQEIGLALEILPYAIGFAGTSFPKVRPPLSSSAEINEFLNRAGRGPVETQGMKDRADIEEFLRQKAEQDGAPKLLEGPKQAPPEELTPAAETMIKAGKVPTPGVDKLVDQFHVAQADRDLATFDKIFELVNMSKTKERSPDAMEAFLSKTPLAGKSVYIPAEAVDKLYGKTEPGPNDELFGYEPDIADKIAFARETGTDLQIPMSRFVAHTDPTVYGNIKQDLRFREEGLTKEEGKDWIDVYHGSPFEFEAFDVGKIGEGEGAQSYGHGLYFAEHPEVAGSYRKAGDRRIKINTGEVFMDQEEAAKAIAKTDDTDILYPLHWALGHIYSGSSLDEAIKTMKKNYEHYGKDNLDKAESLLKQYEPTAEGLGHVYRAKITRAPEEFLDWDKPLSEQSQHVQEAIKKIAAKHNVEPDMNISGEEAYNSLATHLAPENIPNERAAIKTGQPEASKILSEFGVAGIKYLDQFSRDQLEKPFAVEHKSGDLAKRSTFRTREEAERHLAGQERAAKAMAEQGFPSEVGDYSIKDLTGTGTRNFVVFSDKDVIATHRGEQELPPAVQRILDTPAGQLSAAVKKSFYFQPLFQNAKVIGMSEAEYAKYFNKIQKSDEAAYQRLLDKETRKAKREQTLEWKVNEAETQSEVETDMRSRPDIAVDRFIRTGVLPTGEKITPVKLNRAVVARFVKAGQASKDMLERYTTEGGVPPDNIADKFGFNSGAAMIKALDKLEKDRGDLGPKAHFNKLVKDETQRRMEAKHGDLAQNILEEAVDAALAEHNLDILHDELTALAKADGKEAPYTRAELEAYVQGKFKGLKAAEVSFETFRRGSEKAGKAAEKALLAGKFDEAFKAKQQQILSVTAGKLARAFERRQRSGKRLFDRYRDNRVLKNVAQDYTDQIHGILERVGLPTSRNGAELASALKTSLADFLYDKTENLGRIVPVDMELLGSGKKYGDFTTEEADNFRESIKTLDHNGKMEKQLQIGSEKIDHEIAVDRAVTEMDKNKPRYLPRRPNMIQRLQSGVYHWDAMLIKMEQLFDWLDRNDPLGMFNEVVFRGLSEGKHLENDMLKDLGKKMKALPTTKEFNASLDELIDNTELLDWQNGQPIRMTGRDLVAMMLNMGNRSNFEKLTAKYEYNGQEFQFDPMAVKGLVKANATKAHWDFVQAVWDLFESYWPQIEELSRDMSGVAPDKIERVPIKTEWGTYAGGYYPLRADANWVGPRTGATGIFGADRYFRAVPPKGYTLPRTGATYPLDLNYSAIIPTMEQMIHDLAFRRPLAQAVKFLEDIRIKQGIQRAFGPEYLKQVKPWLEYVATTKRLNDEALTGINRMARWGRDRLVAVQLLYRASTIIKHTVAAAFDSFGESGMYTNKAAYLKDFSENTARLYGTPDGHRIISEMFEKSGELRNRMHDMDRDIGEAMDRTLGQSGIRAVATHYGGYGVSLLDLGSAIPTWYTHYKKALALGYDEPDAVVIGDKAVRAAHGSAGPTDLAAIQRGGEVLRLFTVAYTFFSHSYNRIRAIGRETKQGFEDARAGETADAFNKFSSAAWRSLWYIVLLGAAEEAIAPIPTDHGHESIGAMVSKGIAYQLTGTVPFLRDIGRAILYGKGDIAPTPLSSMYTTIGGAVSDVYKQAAGQRVKNNFLREEIEALGYALKLPGAGQAGATAQYLWDLRHHRQTGENPYRFGRGILLGKSHPERRLRR